MDRLLFGRIDKLMVQFKGTEFYDQYTTARAVVNAATRPHKTPSVLAAPNSTPGTKVA